MVVVVVVRYGLIEFEIVVYVCVEVFGVVGISIDLFDEGGGNIGYVVVSDVGFVIDDLVVG